MFLLPIEIVAPFINDYYLTFRDSELLGFMPCSKVENNHAAYYSVDTTKGVRVAPVFYISDMLFDSEPNNATEGSSLFFMGCDDGHMGIKFKSRDEAIQWLNDCPYNDFEFLVQAYNANEKSGTNLFKFEWHN